MLVDSIIIKLNVNKLHYAMIVICIPSLAVLKALLILMN